MDNRKKMILVLLGLLIPFSLTANWYSDIGDSFDKMRSSFSEIQNSIEQTKEFLASVERFVSTLSTVVTAVTSVVGSKTILLLLLVILISSGFRTLGMGAGLFSFLLSLFIADSLWFLWGKSVQTGLLSNLVTILKTNLIILAPVILYFLYKKYSVDIRNLIKRAVFRNFRSPMSLYEAEQMVLLLEHGSQDLIKKIGEDIKKGGKEKSLRISDESYRSLENMKHLLAKIGKKV